MFMYFTVAFVALCYKSPLYRLSDLIDTFSVFFFFGGGSISSDLYS
jgi:hypothetical protein